MDMTHLLATRAGDGKPFIFPGPDQPITFNFDQGLASTETFPMEDMARLTQELFQNDGSDVLDYFDPSVGYEELVFGSRGLRNALAQRYGAKHGRSDFTADNFILTSGSVQAISLAASACLEQGDVAIVEAATFPYAVNYMKSAGAEVISVPVDQDGMNMDALEAVLDECRRDGKRVKLVYTISTFQMPTGVVLSLPRRHRLLDLAAAHDFLIHEDYVYGEMRYEGEEIPSLLSLDDSGRVIHDNSLSKTLAPGLRIGWMAGDPSLINAMGAVRQDLGVSQWMARLAQRYIEDGLLDAHLEKANALYHRKRDAVVQALNSHCGDYVSFDIPQGSFYIWVEVDQRVDWLRAAELAVDAGIYFRPGERFDTADDSRQFIRIAFARVSFETIEKGIKKLGEILRDCEKGD
ncbi:MAG: hypothetical protein CME59_09355 [Halioglobus sp.]|nr:hypothetical protein [Halioglobus sp.]